MRVSAKADYAIRAMVELAANDGGPLKAERIAQAQEIPLKFLENIMTDLRQGSLVRSQRGTEGGYWLARHAEEITLAHVIRAVEGPLANVRVWGTVSRTGRKRSGEGRLAGGADVDDLTAVELEPLGLVARQLHGQRLAVLAHEVDAHLEAEVDDPLDHRLARRTVRLEHELEVVRADERVAEPVGLADERHDELVRGPLVEVDRPRDLLDAAAVHDHDLVGDLHRLFLVVRHDHRGRVR